MFNVILLNKCNLRCSYCFAEDYMHAPTRPASQDEMTFETFVDVVNFLERSGANHVSLLGGEPTLHPRFQDLWSLASEYRMPFSLKSNALWDQATLDFLNRETGPRYHYLLNVNGPERLTPKQWATVRSNVIQLKSEHKYLQLNIEDREFSYQWIVDLALEAGVKKIIWSLAAPIIGAGKKTNSSINYAHLRGFKKLEQFLLDCAESGIETLGTHGPTPCLIDRDVWNSIKGRGALIDGRCVPVFDIFPDRSIHYCFPLKDFFFPQIIDDVETLGDTAQYLAQEMMGYRAMSFPWEECLECPEMKAGICHGGCLAQNRSASLEKNHVSDSLGQIVFSAHPERRALVSEQDQAQLLTMVDGIKTANEVFTEWKTVYATEFKTHNAMDTFYKKMASLLANEFVLINPLPQSSVAGLVPQGTRPSPSELPQA